MTPFAYKVFSNAVTKGLIEEGDKIIIGLSGGLDSMALTCLLQEMREKIQLDLHLVHFHHGLREESDKEEEFVRDFAFRLKLPLSVFKTDHLKGGKGMEQRAREWRRNNFQELLTDLNFNKVVLGHHLDDQIETQLWRMMRGGSFFTFAPIKEIALPYIRPLLNFTKEELREYLNKIDQPWCEDISNQENDYTRNKIRNQIIPLMKECAQGRFTEKMAALVADSLELENDFNSAVKSSVYQNSQLKYDQLKVLSPLYAKEIIHRFLLFNQATEVTRANIESIYNFALKNQGGWQITLKKGLIIKAKKGLIYLD